MWHKAEWMGRLMRLELTRVGLLVKLANRYTTKGAQLLLDYNQIRMVHSIWKICQTSLYYIKIVNKNFIIL